MSSCRILREWRWISEEVALSIDFVFCVEWDVISALQLKYCEPNLLLYSNVDILQTFKKSHRFNFCFKWDVMKNQVFPRMEYGIWL